jgi:hypothetical protein
MASYGDLGPAERRLYHNAADGSYRLDRLGSLLGFVL